MTINIVSSGSQGLRQKRQLINVINVELVTKPSDAISLVRLKNKFGIRTRKEDEQAAWAHLRPGVDFMALGIQLIYELFPIPHGTQRQSIAKPLGDWGWQARPLQPGKGSYTHMAWRVGAQQPPPQTVMTGFQNDIVVTQVKELKSQPPKQ